MQNVVGQPQTVQVPNYSGVNIQIFNPAVNAGGYAPAPQPVTAPGACYPPGYYTQPYGQPGANATATATATVNQPGGPPQTQTQTQTSPQPAAASPAKTEKRDVVQLTDDYIKNLENYLNNQNPEVRLMGAKQIAARLNEDDSRKGDPALNALVNKMLQDPSQAVKFTALAALDSRIATGDNTTVQLLQAIQKQDSNYGLDAMQASEILLKMSGTTVKKEFEVQDKPDKTFAQKMEKYK